jgi:23S rRNA pseudouridine2604 synthase
MCEYFNYKVISLERTRIMNIKLDLPIGEYRELTKEEVSSLNKLVDNE